jgi:hypothetical protein
MELPEIFINPSQLRIKRHAKGNQVSHNDSNISKGSQHTMVCLLLSFEIKYDSKLS